MIQVSQLKKGNIINYKNWFYNVFDKTLHWTARWAWLITLSLKNIITNHNLTETFRDKESFELMDVIKENFLYLYKVKNFATFMNLKSNEIIEIELNNKILQFLSENQEYLIRSINWNYINVIIPEILENKIKLTSDPSWEKLQQSRKKAILSNWVEITWPLHMKNWDIVKYNTIELTYISKLK